MLEMITIHVKPGSRKPGFVVDGETIVLRVRERAVEGAANDACVRAVADAAGVAPSQVELVRGHRGRVKTFSVEGASAEELRARLLRSAGS
jgi:uncharacterized protein